MRRGVLVIAGLANAVALFCLLNPWFEGWASQAVVFFVFESVLAVVVGVPVLVHHLRRGLPFGEALGATLESVMSFLVGWV
jgi:hypothetical protein